VGTRVAALWITGAVMVAVSLGAQAPSSTPTVTRLGGNVRANPPSGPVPRLADGKPDLSGAWLGGGGGGDISTALVKGETITLLPEARKIMEARQAKDDPTANCLPVPPFRTRGGYPWRIVTTPTHVFFLYEVMHGFRQVFMDGRTHPERLDPTWYGHSIGHWEGDTLVVDTIGYNDKTWFDGRGHPHSDKLHTIERYTRTDLGTLAMEITIDDPGAYARPFKVFFTVGLMPGEDLMEYICNENNQDVPHIVGPADPPAQ
jgi:hypothetical protein